MNEFDQDIFKQADELKGLECNHTYFNQCQAMNRLFNALKYYSMIDNNNKNDKEIFNQFINTIYVQLLDDYTHFINYHSCELEIVYNQLINKSMFGLCDINTCKFTSRHQLHHTQNISQFNKRTMDSLHFYIFHCFDVGLRTKKTQLKEEKKK
eukprot:141570_1